MEYYGDTLGEAVRNSLQRELRKRGQFECKNRRLFDAFAPPFIWGPPVEIYGRVGGQENRTVHVKVKFDIFGDAQSPFEVEITGGDYDIYEVGPGTSVVPITGNVLTALSIRCRSLTPYVGLNIRVGIWS